VVYHRELMDPLLHCLTTLTTQGDRVVLAHVRRWKYADNALCYS
jgi:predicted nicotinamide N-methyase